MSGHTASMADEGVRPEPRLTPVFCSIPMDDGLTLTFRRDLPYWSLQIGTMYVDVQDGVLSVSTSDHGHRGAGETTLFRAQCLRDPAPAPLPPQ